MAKSMMCGLDPRLSVYIPLPRCSNAWTPQWPSPAVHGMTDLVRLVGAEWSLDEWLKVPDRLPGAGVERVPTRPRYLYINREGRATRRPRSWVVMATRAAEGILAPMTDDLDANGNPIEPPILTLEEELAFVGSVSFGSAPEPPFAHQSPAVSGPLPDHRAFNPMPE
jgi:hypothetical protein